VQESRKGLSRKNLDNVRCNCLHDIAVLILFTRASSAWEIAQIAGYAPYIVWMYSVNAKDAHLVSGSRSAKLILSSTRNSMSIVAPEEACHTNDQRLTPKSRLCDGVYARV
jgi:hypothetical protein